MKGTTSLATVTLPRGRVLEIATAGPERAMPLVFHGGTPSAATLFPEMVGAALTRGLRVVTYSRPGYAGSTPLHGRSVADAAADVTAVLDALGAGACVTLGWSGGGPHALACAALMPGRCRAAVSLAGVAPYSAEGLDWLAGMAAENIEEFEVALSGETALTRWLETAARAMSAVTGEDVAAALGGLVSEVDRRALSGDFAERQAESIRRAVSQGIAGWRDDDIAFVRDWGFELGAIRVPVAVWQGDQDRMVPFDHGRWLAEHVPGARARLRSGEGHLSLGVAAIDQIVGDLAELAAL